MDTRDPITGLPEGFQLDEPLSELPPGFELDAAEPSVPEGFQLDAAEPSVPRGFQLGPVEPESSGFSNLLSGMGERAATLSGSFLDAIQTVGEGLEKTAPLGGFVWDEGDVLPSYKSAEEFAKTDAPAVLERGAEVLKNIDLGYQERTGWQDVKDAFSEGGFFSGSAYAEVLAYGFEQGIKSIPDMVAVVTAFPAYIVARSGEIGEQRAQNKGKEDADITDVLEAIPFAAASALLELYGTKGMTSVVKENLGKGLMKAGVKAAAKRVAKEGGESLAKEATTEAIQEGMIEYVGERFGTEVAMDFNEAIDRAAGAAVAGGVFGGIVGGGVATVTEAARPGAVTEAARPEPVTPAPTVEGVELMDTQKDIGEATNVDDALAAAEGVLDKRLDLHRQKEAARKALVEAQPKVQEELDTLVTETPLAPGQVEAQPEVREELDTLVTEPVLAPEQIKAQAMVESQAKIRRAEKARPTEALVSDLVLSKDVPQIKTGADVKGVVEPLGGAFDPVGTGPLQVWVRLDGTQEVISGRHRLDLAQRSGTETVAIQKHFEDEGFSLQDAKSLDAILNIREGQGQVKDYVDFVKTTSMTEAEAQEQGILARSTGRQAFTIATKGSGLLIGTHDQGKISDSAATKISLAAPNNEVLQAVGIKAIAEGKTITVAENMTKAVSTFAVAEQPKTADLRGFDNAALVEAEALAKAAGAKQAAVQKMLSATQRAAKEGTDVKDPVAVQSRIAELKQQKTNWANWHSSPELVAELKTGVADTQQAEIDLVKEETQKLEVLAETAPDTIEVAKEESLAPEVTEDVVAPLESAPKAEALTGNSVRFEAYKSTLDKGAKADPAGFETFMADMTVKFGDAGKLSPKGAITNQKDFTQFIQAQTGQKVPLNEINLTRKIVGKDGKLKVVQAKADVILRQTRKKRDLALKLLRCIHG